MSHFEDYDQLGQQSNSSPRFDLDHDAIKKKIKGNTKNTYIKKISSLMKITNSDNANEQNQQPERKSMPQKVQSQQFGCISDKEDKLAKNRESARNSRRRKKIYLELLESKVTKLSESLELFKSVNERTQDLAVTLQNKINQKREQDHTKVILFTNLQNALQGNTSENNIDSIIDSLNKKFGSGSVERQHLIDHYARQIYENCLAPYINYILGVARLDQDVFSMNQDNQNPEHQVLQKLKLTDKQKQMLIKKQQKLIRNYNDLMSTLSSIQEVKNQVQMELASFDSTLEQLRRELKPSQVARFLLAIEKKDMQHHFKEAFEKCFGSEIDEDDSLDLYQFMTEHNQCNSLGIDIQQTYDIYRASNDFLNNKFEITDDQQLQQTKVE